MKIWKLIVFSMVMITNTAFEAPRLYNEIVAIVNNKLLFKSDIDHALINFKLRVDQSNDLIPDDKTIREEVIEQVILQSIILQIIQKNNIIITDQELDKMVQNIAQQENISVQKLYEDILKSGINYNAYRKYLREKMQFAKIYHQDITSRIYISPEEVNMMVNKIISEDNQQTELKINQILLNIPEKPTQQQINNQKKIAYKIISALKSNTNFNKIKNLYSSNIGLIKNDTQWNKITEYPSLFTEKLIFAKKGDIIGPLKCDAGFYILQINDIHKELQPILVNEIRARYITLKTSSFLNDKEAYAKLKQLLANIKNGKINFAAAEKKFSTSYHLSQQNENYNWESLESYDPKYQKIIFNLQQGEISPPIHSEAGWHLIQILDKRQVDKTNEILKKQAYNILLNQKIQHALNIWMCEQLDNNYINIL